MVLNALSLHIGLHKSASTYLQDLVFPYIPSHNYIKTSDFNEIIARMMDAGPYYQINQQHEALCNLIKKSELPAENPWIFSHEALSGYVFSGRGAGTMARDASVIFKPKKILLVLRGQIDFIRSAYCHYVKEGGTLFFKDFLIKRASPAVEKRSTMLDRLDYWAFYKNSLTYMDRIISRFCSWKT